MAVKSLCSLSFAGWALWGCSGGGAEGAVPAPFPESVGGRDLLAAGGSAASAMGGAPAPGNPGGAGAAATPEAPPGPTQRMRSKAQWWEQPSPESRLPSSHCSGSWRTPSPQRSARRQVFVQLW